MSAVVVTTTNLPDFSKLLGGEMKALPSVSSGPSHLPLLSSARFPACLSNSRNAFYRDLPNSIFKTGKSRVDFPNLGLFSFYQLFNDLQSTRRNKFSDRSLWLQLKFSQPKSYFPNKIKSLRNKRVNDIKR